MNNNKDSAGSAFVLGALLCVGLALLGYFVSGGIVRIRALDRTVEVKGLSEREVPADIAIWPIRFNEADNDLNLLFLTLERKNAAIEAFLKKRGFKEDEISVSAPAIQDRQAQGYSDTQIKFRYSGASTLTVYTRNVDSVRNAMKDLVELGKQGIAIAGQDYEAKTEYLFTRLNDIKPDMVEEATKNARLVAEKFARDSQSGLGKIKRAVQGQFSINDRDSNTPHIKKVRVVSTLEYYLAD
ncbi:MAG: SIMPL domain-containing protein [Desulfobacterales bacterium]|nr:SIMPL domain-containing protein [Desulfobacterales bacterium]MDD3951445.1 SIMPL domain-containing protein [Desulfobacterales bacterium]MDD4463568.1 SIMPL domain-containing protein [Desulfobacterales bacterium]